MRILLVVLCCCFPLLPVQAQSVPLKLAGRVEHGPITEMSGIVKSRNRENVYWVHNDSGDGARIFAIDEQGTAIIPTYSRFSFYGGDAVAGKQEWPGFKVLFAENHDWEDMTIDDNFIYIADTGNNFNIRKDLGIYMISEIDPTASTQSAAIKHLPVRYPEQTAFPGLSWHFDSESLFTADGELYLITKHRHFASLSRFSAGANLYRLDTHHTDRDNLLTLVDSHAALTAATSAELSPDGLRLAVLSYDGLWLFDRPQDGDHWLSSSHTTIALRRSVVHQAEAVTWIDAHTVLITNEQGDMFRLDVSRGGAGS